MGQASFEMLDTRVRLCTLVAKRGRWMTSRSLGWLSDERQAVSYPSFASESLNCSCDTFV